MALILPALLKAIRESDSASRVLITSRYQFPVPPGTTIVGANSPCNEKDPASRYPP